MKRFACAALAAGVLLAGWAAPARAHGDEDEGPQAAGGMKEALGLGDDQAAKLKDAMTSHREAVKPLHEQVRAGMDKLKGQLKAKAPDAEVQATLDQLKAARKSMAAEQEKFHESLGSILTPTQQAKMLVRPGTHMRRGPWKKRGPRHERHDRHEHHEDHD